MEWSEYYKWTMYHRVNVLIKYNWLYLVIFHQIWHQILSLKNVALLTEFLWEACIYHR